MLTLATDGSCLSNGEASTQARARVFYEEGSQLNRCIKVPLHLHQLNETGKFLVLKEAAEQGLVDANLDIKLDSMYVINLVIQDLQKNENEGYINTANANLAQLTVARLRERRTKYRLIWVKGHSGQVRNKDANRLASVAAKAAPIPLNLEICPLL